MFGKLKGKLKTKRNLTTSAMVDEHKSSSGGGGRIMNNTNSSGNNNIVDNNGSLQLNQVELTSTGMYHNDVLMAKVGDDLVGGMGMEEEIEVSWYRKSGSNTNCRYTTIEEDLEDDEDVDESEEFVRIQGVSSAYYSPSADDVGATICFRCVDKINRNNHGFAQIGPLVMEPAVEEGVKNALARKPPGGSFEGKQKFSSSSSSDSSSSTAAALVITSNL
jgi:hypothetical protein